MTMRSQTLFVKLPKSRRLTQSLSLLRDATPRIDNQTFVDAQAELLELLPQLENGSMTTEQLQTICATWPQCRRFARPKDWPSKEAYDEYKDLCTELRELHRKAPARAIGMTQSRRKRLGLVWRCCDLRRASPKSTTLASRRMNKLDFDDLLCTATNDLLPIRRMSHCATSWPDDLRLLLVDEFQDTDQLQVDLVIEALRCRVSTRAGCFSSAISSNRSTVFAARSRRSFAICATQMNESGRLPLTINFRSQPAILNFVNALFHEAFGGDRPRLRSAARRTAHKSPMRTRSSFFGRSRPTRTTTVSRRRDGSSPRLEARAIARRLRSLVDDEQQRAADRRQRNGQAAPPQTGDVAILFRTLGDVQVYEEALREYGLDYYLVGGHAFYAQQEIFDVLNLLRAVASTADEVEPGRRTAQSILLAGR